MRVKKNISRKSDNDTATKRKKKEANSSTAFRENERCRVTRGHRRQPRPGTYTPRVRDEDSNAPELTAKWNTDNDEPNRLH